MNTTSFPRERRSVGLGPSGEAPATESSDVPLPVPSVTQGATLPSAPLATEYCAAVAGPAFVNGHEIAGREAADGAACDRRLGSAGRRAVGSPQLITAVSVLAVEDHFVAKLEQARRSIAENPAAKTRPAGDFRSPGRRAIRSPKLVSSGQSVPANRMGFGGMTVIMEPQAPSGLRWSWPPMRLDRSPKEVVNQFSVTF